MHLQAISIEHTKLLFELSWIGLFRLAGDVQSLELVRTFASVFTPWVEVEHQAECEADHTFAGMIFS